MMRDAAAQPEGHGRGPARRCRASAPSSPMRCSCRPAVIRRRCSARCVHLRCLRIRCRVRAPSRLTPQARSRLAEPRVGRTQADRGHGPTIPLGDIIKADRERAAVIVADGAQRRRRPMSRVRRRRFRRRPCRSPAARRVAGVQRALTEYGYGQLKPTGTIGADTQAAIQKFERERQDAGDRPDVGASGARTHGDDRPRRSTSLSPGWRCLVRWPTVLHAIEISHLGGGLSAPLPDRGHVRRGAPARRGGGRRGVRQGRAARRQRDALRAGAADRL